MEDLPALQYVDCIRFFVPDLEAPNFLAAFRSRRPRDLRLSSRRHEQQAGAGRIRFDIDHSAIDRGAMPGGSEYQKLQLIDVLRIRVAAKVQVQS